MDSNRAAPVSLKIVAGLFILIGICAAIETVISLMHNSANINFGVLGFLIGPGLLRFSRDWRTCALFFLWIVLIGVPVFALLLMVQHAPLDLKVFGQKVGEAPKELGLGAALVGFLLALWQYRVLTRPDIRKLFGIGAN